MYWRLKHSEFQRQKGEPNRRAFEGLVAGGAVPGILAYVGNEPVGWCAVEPRRNFVRLETARTLKPIDDMPVWSIPCFYVRRGYRGRGVSVALLGAAARHVAAAGGHVLEGYPAASRAGRMAEVFAYTGLISAFRKVGFREVARPSASRAIMRLDLGSEEAAVPPAARARRTRRSSRPTARPTSRLGRR